GRGGAEGDRLRDVRGRGRREEARGGERVGGVRLDQVGAHDGEAGERAQGGVAERRVGAAVARGDRGGEPLVVQQAHLVVGADQEDALTVDPELVQDVAGDQQGAPVVLLGAADGDGVRRVGDG